MPDLLKVSSVLIIIVILLKRKWNLGLVMVVSSVVLSALYLMNPKEFILSFFRASAEKTTLVLIIVLTLIRVFENIMRKRGLMKQMMDAFRGLVMDRRVLMASMPAVIGLLPSMGGALFSAPMVDEASKGINASPEKKAFINYIFRHPWEFISPLYPGLVLTAAITAHSVRDMIFVNFPYALCLVAGGVIWGLGGLGVQKESFRALSQKGFLSFMPLAVIIILVVAFHLDLSISMAAVVAALYISFRYSFTDILQNIRESFSWELVVIILGVMTFKEVLHTSGAVVNISTFLSEENIPVLPVLFIIPFLSGLLTGLTIGFVGSTFPILTGIEEAQGISSISFAFAAGYTGVLLSPVHLCLILTREYFRANMAGIYSRIIKVGIAIMAVALIEYFILNH